MALDAMPGCCNAFVLHGFGGTAAAQRMQYGDEVNPNEAEQQQMIDDAVHTAGQRLICAYTNTDQTVANRLLRRAGFQRTRSMDKRHHPETQLIMWWRRPGGE
jgi:hypothetical protein